MAEKEDRISALPDHLIHRILSLLPSTKEAFRTATLSKRWRHQWTGVSVLIFHPKDRRRDVRFVDFINKTLALHDCSKISTFHLKSIASVPNFDDCIRFAAARQVEDLNLSRPVCGGIRSLPQFLFSSTSLVKLTTTYFSYDPAGEVNWVRLKALNLHSCWFSDQALEFVLSGSPLLESLELKLCSAYTREIRFEKLVITSKSLKKLDLEHTGAYILDISCPNLKELYIKEFSPHHPRLFDLAIQKVMSNSLLLESFMLLDCKRVLHRPVIASRSLKRLVMGNLTSRNSLEVSCQELEELEISGYMNMVDVKFRDVPSSLCATLDIHIRQSSIKNFNRCCKDTLQQLQHIKELRVGSFMNELLRVCAKGGLPFPMLHVKCLILDQPVFVVPLSIIAYVLRHLPILETLVCNLDLERRLHNYDDDDDDDDMANLDSYGESNSSLKTVKIYGLGMDASKPKCMLNLVRFLLNKARVLQSMTVVLKKSDCKDISFSISQALFRIPRCSENAVVELISQCS